MDDEYRRHGYLSRDELRAAVYREVDRLLELDQATDPSQAATEKDKDQRAFEAIRVVSWISRMVCGWAVRHQLGLAQSNLSFVGRGPVQARELPIYLDAKSLVDSHQHEATGSKLAAGDIPVESQRRLIVEFMRAGGGGLPYTVARRLQRALEKLSYGEVDELLAPTKASRKVSLERLELQRAALEYIAFQKALGVKAIFAMQDVADAYGVSFDTVKGWPAQLRKAFGALRISFAEAGARNQASYYHRSKDPDFDMRLAPLGEAYRSLSEG